MERKYVYVFSAIATLFFALLVYSSATRQGWFSPTVNYSASFDTGEGVFVGTPVSMAGLKAGVVKKVELSSDNKVIVQFNLRSQFAERVRKNSKAVLGRPFIIGERAISITPGSNHEEILAPGSMLVGEESLEITDLLGGGRLSPYFQTFNTLMTQLQLVIEGDGTKDGARLIDLYKQAYITLKGLEVLSKDVSSIKRDFVMAPETQKIIRDLAASSQELKGLLVETQKALPAVTGLSQNVVELMPQLTKTLTETTFTLQALQRSFILSGGVSRLKDEMKEEEKKKNEQRTPASEIRNP